MPVFSALAAFTIAASSQGAGSLVFSVDHPKLRTLSASVEKAHGDYLELLRAESRALRELKAMMDRDELKTGNDFHAASLLVINVPSYEGRMLVHEFAMTALLLGEKAAGPRAKLTWDRLQYDAGHPARFGMMRGRPDEDGNRPVLRLDPEGPLPILGEILGGTAAAPGEPNAELQSLMESDQKDRRDAKTPEDWDRMTQNDVPRRARVLQILAQGKASTGADLYNAALVLQHGNGYRDYMLAHELCLGAIARGYKEAAWLVSRTYDRMLQSVGRAQRFTTQQSGGRDGKTFYVIDADLPGPSDTMRKAFNAPTRAKAKEGYELWMKSINGG